MPPSPAELLDRSRIRPLFRRSRKLGEGLSYLAKRVADELLDRLSLLAPPDGAWLDLGCGEGYLWRRLQARQAGREVVAGLDLAPLPGKMLIAGDAHQMPFAPDAFGFVVSNLMLPWCDPGALFREVRRVTRPGGAFLFSTFGPGTLEELRQAWSAVDDLPHVHPMVDMHDLGDALLHSGFRDPVMDTERLTVEYAGLDRLFDDLRHSGFTYIAGGRRPTLTGKKRFSDFRGKYEALADESGRFPVTFEVVYGYARTPANSVEVAAPEWGNEGRN